MNDLKGQIPHVYAEQAPIARRDGFDTTFVLIGVGDLYGRAQAEALATKGTIVHIHLDNASDLSSALSAGGTDG